MRILDIHLNPFTTINTLNIFGFSYIKIILQIVDNVLTVTKPGHVSEKPANSMIFRHFNFVTNIIYYIIRKIGYVPEKPVKSTIINGSIFSLF